MAADYTTSDGKTVLAPQRAREGDAESAEPSQLGPNKPGTVPKAYTHAGRTMTVAQWSAYLGIPIPTLYNRIASKMSPKEIFSSEKLKTGVPDGYHFNQRAPKSQDSPSAMRIEYDGRNLTIRQWSIEIGLSAATIRCRLRQGLSLDQVLDANKNVPRPLARPDIPRFRCFVCNETMAPRIVEKGSFVVHDRFRKAHLRCYKDWKKIQHELTGARKRLKDLDGE